MNILDRGIVFQGKENTDTQSAAYPGICVLPDGRWLCSFRVAPAKKDVWPETTFLAWSDDNGATWSQPVQPWPDRTVEGKTGSVRSAYLTALGGSRIVAALFWTDHSNPELPFFNEETEGLLDTRILLSFSDDNGTTWSEPKLVDTAPITVATPLTGPILVLPNGDWACQIELNKHYYDLEPWRHLSLVLFSSDEGKSWGASSCTSNHPENTIFYWDQRPNVLADGSVLDVFWTYDRTTDKYLNIQANRSTDNGRTWSPMWDTGLPGQPAQPISLSDGRTALVYVDRTAAPTIKVRVSDDGGKTWPDSTETILYSSEGQTQTWKKTSMQDAWAEMGAFSVGLPATAKLDDGSVLVTYYAGPKTDYTAIEWVRIK